MTNQNEYAVMWRLEGQTRVYAESPEAAGDLVQEMLDQDVKPLLSAAFGPVTNVVLRSRVTAAPALSSGLATERDQEFAASRRLHTSLIEKAIEFIDELLEMPIPQPRDQLVIDHGEVQ